MSVSLRAALLFAALSLNVGLAAAQQIEGLHGPAAATLAGELRKTNFLFPIEVNLFYGDLTGHGTNDAVALIYHPTGGNSLYLDEWLLWDRHGRYDVVKVSPLQDIVGDSARDVTFSPGMFEVTMTVMNPGDARCCPSGEKRFSVALGASAAGRPVSSAAPAAADGPWTARQTSDPVGVEVEAASSDGRSRLVGTCATEVLPPGLWLTFLHDGKMLERTHQKTELLLLEITGRNDVQYFTASMRHEGPGNSWVANRPLSEDFLNALAVGMELRVSGGGTDGGGIARFALRGTAKAVRMMREVCGKATTAAAAAPVALPFADGRYLSDPSLCGLDDGEIVARIGDEIHYVLYVIESGHVGGAESLCEVRDLDRNGDVVRLHTECATEGTVTATTMEMTYISEKAFRAGERVFKRCD